MTESAQESNDLRLVQLKKWLTSELPGREFTLAPASADASFRRYFRLTPAEAGATLIVMDAPPEREDSAAFVRIAELMRTAGVHVPKILAQDLAQGFLLLSDLGHQTYLQVITGDNAGRLFDDAINALITWQQASQPGVLNDYDASELERELQFFPQWYLQRHLQIELSADEQAAMARVFADIVNAAQNQAKVFVHRDYMPRNLMLSEPNPGVLDFQDARYGPIAYDVLCLFKDAFLSWPERRVTGWLEQYWHAARAAGLPVPGDFQQFQRDVDWIGVQRHLKVLGIFARICHRDGKPHYLQDAPRFLNYLRPVLARYPEFEALAAIVNKYCPH